MPTENRNFLPWTEALLLEELQTFSGPAENWRSIFRLMPSLLFMQQNEVFSSRGFQSVSERGIIYWQHARLIIRSIPGHILTTGLSLV